MSDWDNLTERLKRLGVQLGIPQPLKQTQNKAKTLEELIPGRSLKTIYGDVFSLNHAYPAEGRHGHLPLKPLTEFSWLSKWANAPSVPALEKLVFLDTETTGLSGGTGTMPFMIGAGRFGAEGFVMEQFFVRNPAEEPAQLAALSEFVEGVEGIVTYNGKAFDLPIINARFIMQRLSNPFTTATHYDLLHYTRRIWKARLGQCNLGNIERQILGFTREQADIPGYLVPEIYRDYLFKGETAQLPGVFYHNEIDVLSLSALFSWLAAILEDPSNERLTEPGDLPSLGRVLELLGRETLAEQLYSSDRMEQLSHSHKQETVLSHARIQKRAGNTSAAVGLWHQAALNGSVEALLELAKYYEHHQRNYPAALECTEKALSISKEPPLIQALLHRKSRLERKNAT